MRLSEFILKEKEAILREWEDFARTLMPAASGMSASAIRDHGAEILDAVALNMEQPQSGQQRLQKSRGKGAEDAVDAVGHVHAGLRLEAGFDLDQVISEYRALRASVVRFWTRTQPEETKADRDQVTRFNEAIDQMLAESVRSYTQAVTRYRDQFLGILGHDLRNPLGAIVMSATFLSRSEDLGSKHVKSATRILGSAQRISRLVDLLLDLTRTRLGSGIPIAPTKVDLRAVCRQVLDELEAFHPDRQFRFDARTEVHGSWDADRLAQVVSNLVGNALQHGARDAPVSLSLREEGDEVVLEVHNQGPPIPEKAQATIFEPMIRRPADLAQGDSAGLGLGLFIVREVVVAHGGRVSVTSSLESGTTFTVRLPHQPPKPQA